MTFGTTFVFLTIQEDPMFASSLSPTDIFSSYGQLYLYLKFSLVSPTWHLIHVRQSDFDIWYVNWNSSLTERTGPRGNLSDFQSEVPVLNLPNSRYPQCLFVIFRLSSRTIRETLPKKKHNLSFHILSKLKFNNSTLYNLNYWKNIA